MPSSRTRAAGRRDSGGPTGGSDPALDRLKAVLGGWRSSLLDLGGRNRLLNFRHTRTATLEITAPDASTVLAGLPRGWFFAPLAGGEPVDGSVGGEAGEGVAPGSGTFYEYDSPSVVGGPGRTSGLVTQKNTQAGLDASLYQLRQKSGQMYNDYGLWVLWLGVGMLDWREAGAEETSSAPLLLVPVELRRDGRRQTSLHLAEDQDRIHNPALAVKLERLGVDWSSVANCDVGDLGAVLAAARDVARTQDGWSVDERVVLGLFASHKEAMYQDLQQNEERILAHPLVRAVGLGPDAGLPDDLIGFEPPELDRIDEIQLPERTPLVLDADSSQRQCIAAALDGRSFVMSGPPGTGKSQTITNMIAALMHAGRSVLFVSEKAAALDVVRNRLSGVGLGDFVMALHSGDTSKKAVATELERVLTTEVRITGAAEHELDRARRLREELSAYAAAMNQTREPLGRSLHDVLGRLVLLEQADTPQLALGARSTGTVRRLSAGELQALLEAAGAVSRAWRPAAEGEAFVWRGLQGASAPTTVLAEAADALADLRTAAERRPFAATTPEPRTVHDVRQAVRTLQAGLPDRDPATVGAAGGGLPEDLSASMAQLADLFGLPKPETVQVAFDLLELADLASAAKRPPVRWFDEEGLREAHGAAQELRAALAARVAARAAAGDVFGEQVLEAEELPALVERFAEQHRGVFARLSGQYREDRAAAAELTRGGTWDKTLPQRLNDALAWQNTAAEVARLVARHEEALGGYVPRDEDELPALDAALAVADRIAELTRGIAHRELLTARLSDGTEPGPLPGLLARGIRGALASWCDVATRRAARWSESSTALCGLFEEPRQVQLSFALFGTFDQAQQAVDELRADPRGPEEWQAYRCGLDLLARHGVDELVPRAVERGILPGQLLAVVEQAVLKCWADDLLATDTRLATTRSADLDARVANFREADRRLVAAASGAVIEACNKRRPRRFSGGAALVIKKQAELKRRHMPVRELLGRTREVVRLIKPCFMMSPLTVSQFLPGDYHFDVVIFDEASQVRPADAINCVYRADSLIVAGDEKQLPPTSFFDSAVEDDSDQYDEDVLDTFESLLHACKAGALRELSLLWHYRSRHEDLITFSNRSFYGNSMVTFPGALDHGNDIGVDFFHAQGVYDRGGRRDNRVEAEFVARRVIHHFDTRPNRTLGVVALSQAQAAAIDQAVQQARLLRPDLDHCFTEDRLDGFFVKNLESVQGDERDVVIMSIGYGPDEHGKLATNFGPINRGGGWRRLNVAVTRARLRMEVVASFRGSGLTDSANESVQHLKRYLEYAENGPAVLAQDVTQADAEPDSPFEESVLQVLRAWGYRVQPQVGVAGYRIDIGVRHPEFPGAYALGIECDGAMYHSSRTARDRDRLREEVLAGLGWRLHRIWGTDWYRGRAAAELRLREAVELAVERGPMSDFNSADPRTGPAVAAGDGEAGDASGTRAAAPLSGASTWPGAPGPGNGTAPAAPAYADHERVPVDTEPDRPWSSPYETCEMTVSSPYELHTLEARPALRKLLTRVIGVEGPIHEELLVQRARESWGVARAGNRIRDNVRDVVRALVRSGQVTVDGHFLDVADRKELDARAPLGGDSPRKAAHIAPVERQLALYELAAECPGMSRDELVRHAGEFFGWRRMGRDIRNFLDSDIDELHRRGKLREADGHITAVSDS
jgi:very-short-patch-repair endonuclease